MSSSIQPARTSNCEPRQFEATPKRLCLSFVSVRPDQQRSSDSTVEGTGSQYAAMSRRVSTIGFFRPVDRDVGDRANREFSDCVGQLADTTLIGLWRSRPDSCLPFQAM